MSERTAFLLCLPLLAFAVMSCTSDGDPRGPRNDRPNILIILTDDQRAGGTLQVMPKTMEWFGDGGVTFANAFATTPRCCPSRASIFTGQYVHNNGVLGNARRWAEIMDQDATMQRYLDDLGYRTGFYGKFLNHWNVKRDPPHFDDWALFPGGAGLYYEGGKWNINGRTQKVDEYYTPYISALGQRFIEESERDDDRPWALFLHVTAPHPPAIPEPRYATADVGSFTRAPATAEADISDKPPYVRQRQIGERKVREDRRMELRTLLSVDDLVDDVFRTLVEADEDRRTLAVFLSDNGKIWGEHGIRGKSVPYMESIQIPLMLRWPDAAPADVESDEIVANIDVAPTVVDAIGADRALRRFDGRSLLETLDGNATRSTLLLEHWGIRFKGIPPWASLLTHRYHYTEYYTPDRREVIFREYYDLRSDPSELENLLRDGRPENRPNVVKLSRRLAAAQRCRGTAECP